MLDFQLSTVIFTVLNLLILYVVLRKLLFGRVNRILEERAALVEKELSSAERQKAQAEEMRKEYEDQLAQAHAQAAKIVDQAKARGEQEYQAILDQAQEDTRRMQEQAQAKNRADREKLMRSARQEVAQLAVLAAAKVTGQALDQDSDRAMAEQFLSEAGERTREIRSSAAPRSSIRWRRRRRG